MGSALLILLSRGETAIEEKLIDENIDSSQNLPLHCLVRDGKESSALCLIKGHLLLGVREQGAPLFPDFFVPFFMISLAKINSKNAS